MRHDTPAHLAAPLNYRSTRSRRSEKCARNEIALMRLGRVKFGHVRPRSLAAPRYDQETPATNIVLIFELEGLFQKVPSPETTPGNKKPLTDGAYAQLLSNISFSPLDYLFKCYPVSFFFHKHVYVNWDRQLWYSHNMELFYVCLLVSKL